MPDPIVAADALPAGSSPAAASVYAEPVDSLSALSEPELQAWRTSGDLPSRTSPVTDAAAASSTAPPVQDPAVSTETPPQADPESADPIKAKTKARIDELLAGQARERDRADRAERHIREQETRHAQPIADARPAASSAAPAGPIAPDPETFPYGTADPGYLKALTAFTVAETLAGERTKWEDGQRVARAEQESRQVMAAFHEKADASRALHADFDAVAMIAPTFIPKGGLADLFVLENKADDLGVGGAEVLYHLQQPANVAEQKRILALPTMDQFIALVRLGDRLKVGAAATTTSAPPPPPTLSTRATPADPVARAWALGDSDAATAAIMAAENAVDLARLKR